MIGLNLLRLALVIAGIGFSVVSQALEIRNVYSRAREFNPAQGEQFKLHFELDQAAAVKVRFYDGRDLLVRQLDLGKLSAGSHSALWDGRDDRGRQIPAEAYVYTLKAVAGGTEVEHDLTDITGGEHYVVRNIEWDQQNKQLRYKLPSPSRINIRVGLGNGGPAMATVVDWVARGSTPRAEPWNGWDASQALDLSRHPALEISGMAFTLSDNSILVGAPAQAVELLDGLVEKRQAKQTSPHKISHHRLQPLETRGDFRLKLSVPDDLPRDSEGVPIVSALLPLRIDIEGDPAALGRRFEQMLFLDGLYVAEAEMGFFPMTWRWDPAGINDGIHYLTANVRGYESNFGMATLKIRVQHPAVANASLSVESEQGTSQ
jgi:hypothetical protein